MNNLTEIKKGKIWAVGGGKGGTGKTFITSSIGIHLAKTGKKVVLIDVDIGGANLHSLLGINRPKKSLTNFFESGTSLSMLRLETGIENMSLISGDIHSLASDNVKFTQKLKLFRHLMKLTRQYVLVDLGGGSHYNTIDTFLIADKKIAVVEPEIIAIENMYHFIKNALFRRIRMSLSTYGFKDIVDQMWEQRKKYNIKSLIDLIVFLKENFSYTRDLLDRELSEFRVYLILNKIRNSQDILLGSSVKSIFMKYLGIKAQFVGYIEYDDTVWKSIRERKPFLLHYSSSRSAKEIEVLTENLINDEEVRFPIG